MQKLRKWQTEIMLQRTRESPNCISTLVEGKEEEEDVDASNRKYHLVNDNCNNIKPQLSHGMASKGKLPKNAKKAKSRTKTETSDSEKEKLFDMFKEYDNSKYQPIRDWSGVQHYVYYTYRRFLSIPPSDAIETFPPSVAKRFRELVERLLHADRTQFFLRLLAILREFTYVGKGFIKNNSVTKVSANLTLLLAYYSAFCSAADKLSSLMPEFDALLSDRFQINWLCLNKSMFYHYIYLDSAVQSKLPSFAKLQQENKSFHRNLIDSFESFKKDMNTLSGLWKKMRMCISVLSKKNALENPETKLLQDWRTYQEHTRILKEMNWIIRTEEQKNIQDQSQLDAHLLASAGCLGPMADSVIDKIGHCMCDDCIAEEFYAPPPVYKITGNKSEPEPERRIACYICREIITLETFITHVVAEHDNPSRKKKEKRHKPTRMSVKLAKLREDAEGAEDPNSKTRRTKSDKRGFLPKGKIHWSAFNPWDEAATMRMVHLTLAQNAYEPPPSSSPPPVPTEEELRLYGPPTPEEFDRRAEKLFSEYLRKRAGLTHDQVIEACRKGAEKVAKKKAAEKKKEKEKGKKTPEKEQKNIDEKEKEKDKKPTKAEAIERKVAAIAAERKAAFVAAAFAAEKKAAEGRAAERKAIERKLAERKPSEGKEKEKKEVERKDAEKKEAEKKIVEKKGEKEVEKKGVEKKKLENEKKVAGKGELERKDSEKKENEKKVAGKGELERKDSEKKENEKKVVGKGKLERKDSEKKENDKEKIEEKESKNNESEKKGAEKKEDEKKEPEKKVDEQKIIEKKDIKTSAEATPEEVKNIRKVISRSSVGPNSNSSSTTSSASTNKANCQGHSCGHTCSLHEAELGSLDCCNHHKELLKKCDCPYCEVLGSTLSSDPWQKTSETRDRLRTRLHRRKERGKIFPSPTSSFVTSPVTAVNPKSSNSEKASGGNAKVHTDTPLQGDEAPQFPISDVPIEYKIANSRVPVIPEFNSNKMVISNPRTPRGTRKTPTHHQKTAVTNPIPTTNFVNSSISNPVPKVTDQSSATRSTSSLSTSSLNSLWDNGDSRDINELLNFIEGNKKIDKIALAEKKAAKKARQKKKRDEEKKRAELEIKRREEQKKREERKQEEKLKEEKRKEEKRKEEKRKEEERLKAEVLAKEQAEKPKKKKDNRVVIPDLEQQMSKSTGTKKKEKKKTKVQEDPKPIEETIPAMVTIKRIAENTNSSPTVTITLKGSTPDQDKLLYTLVNGQTKETTATATVKTEKKGKGNKAEIKIKPENLTSTTKKVAQVSSKTASKKSKKTKKKEKLQQQQLSKTNSASELKVTLALDKDTLSAPTEEEDAKKTKKQLKQARKAKANNSVINGQNKSNQKEQKSKQKTFVSTNETKKDETNVSFPMLKIPPGITITKIDGPAVNRNHKTVHDSVSTNTFVTANPNVPGNKSGVIVVDTEKLIQQSFLINENKKMKKKNKKANKNAPLPVPVSASEIQTPTVTIQNTPDKETGPSMVTLKNPIFHSLQSALGSNKCDKIEVPVFPCNQQASIIKNENGMVTIRSPRLQQIEGGTPISSILSDLKPVVGPDSPVSYWKHHSENERISPFNAQAILSGLPGIEITKIDKNGIKSDYEFRKNNQPADVSIIPTSNNSMVSHAMFNSDKVHHDKEDWYESVFTPKDILEEDMDAAERDIEAFKRFCQQTVVPERKERVAHLNVQDIVFKKKADLSFFS